MGDMGWIEQPKELEKEIAQMLDKVMKYFSQQASIWHNEAETFIHGGSDNLIFNDPIQVRL